MAALSTFSALVLGLCLLLASMISIPSEGIVGVYVLSHFSHVRLFVTLRTATRQAPLSMGFSRQEYWSGVPCPPSEDLSDPGIEPAFPASTALQADSLPLVPLGKPQ